MEDIREWKRVRVAKWTTSIDARAKMIRKVKPKFIDTTFQLMDNLIGVTVPASGRDVIVMPMEYRDGGNPPQYQKIDCTRTYFKVPKQWLSELGDAYDEEVAKARQGCKSHGITVDNPQDLRWKRLKARFLAATADEFLEENIEADSEKEDRRNRRSTM